MKLNILSDEEIEKQGIFYNQFQIKEYINKLLQAQLDKDKALIQPLIEQEKEKVEAIFNFLSMRTLRIESGHRIIDIPERQYQELRSKCLKEGE
jgi:hypothetical protein